MYLSNEYFENVNTARLLWFIKQFIDWRYDMQDPEVFRLLQEHEPEWIDIAANYIAATAVEYFFDNLFRKHAEENDNPSMDYCINTTKEHFVGTLKGMKVEFLDNSYEDYDDDDDE